MAQVQLSDVFVEMADTLVDDFDVLDFLHVLADRCVQLLGVSAAGLLVTVHAGIRRAVKWRLADRRNRSPHTTRLTDPGTGTPQGRDQ